MGRLVSKVRSQESGVRRQKKEGTRPPRRGGKPKEDDGGNHARKNIALVCAMHIGIVGAGGISDTHARAALSVPGVTVAAVYGANHEKTARLASQYGGTAYDDFDRFLAHAPMDAVAIGSPSGLHAEQGIAAARRGLHVIV